MLKPEKSAFQFLIFLFLLALFLTPGCSGPSSSPAASIVPPDVFFTLSYDGSIYLVHGDGSDKKELIGGGYSQSTLSPDKTKIACVKPSDFCITVFDLNPQSEIEGKPKSIYNSDALHATGEFGKAFSPLWSSDGKKIYFLNNNHLVCYDYDLQRTTVLVDFPEDQLGDILSHEPPKDGSALYAATQDKDGLHTIWSVDLGTNQAVSIAVLDKESYSGFRFPSSLSDDAIQSLFGSRENPVLEPVICPGDRFYFYLVQKENTFLTKHSVEGYDKTQKLKFEVTTL
jgi:hypothetical protein